MQIIIKMKEFGFQSIFLNFKYKASKIEIGLFRLISEHKCNLGLYPVAIISNYIKENSGLKLPENIKSIKSETNVILIIHKATYHKSFVCL